MPADVEVKVNLVSGTPGQPGHVVPALPGSMFVSQTVHYSSADGAVTIEFVVDGTPFVDSSGNDITTVTDKDVLPLKKSGTFTCHCFVTPPGSTVRVGWDPQTSPMSGGIHVVKPGPPPH
jgi:hypothetical protein